MLAFVSNRDCKLIKNDLWFQFVKRAASAHRSSQHNFTKNICIKFRSSRSEVFCKKGALRNFAKFTGKNLRQRLFLNKVAGL